MSNRLFVETLNFFRDQSEQQIIRRDSKNLQRLVYLTNRLSVETPKICGDQSLRAKVYSQRLNKFLENSLFEQQIIRRDSTNLQRPVSLSNRLSVETPKMHRVQSLGAIDYQRLLNFETQMNPAVLKMVVDTTTIILLSLGVTQTSFYIELKKYHTIFHDLNWFIFFGNPQRNHLPIQKGLYKLKTSF